ncbi:glycosyl hydrolase [Paenibacillus lentus]|uniref:glycosyl hydrolase n=1 Tax=Paenibacillus lentus TaxID=1338368 RepID=UPI003656C9CD
MKKLISYVLVLAVGMSLWATNMNAFSGEVTVGEGSYSTVLPPGATDAPSSIYKTSNVTGKMPTNDWWSSLAWNPHSEAQYPHPLAMKNQEDGIRIYYPGARIAAQPGFVAGWMNDIHDFTVSHSAVSSFSDAKVDGFSDWFVNSLYQQGSSSMNVSYGHGSPYVYFTFAGGDPKLKFYTPPTVWSGSSGSSVLGITIEGAHYGLFGATGTTWGGIGSNTLTNHLNGKNYFSVAVLPDNSPETLNKFKQYAYSHITDTKVDYAYNEASSEVTTTFTASTTAKEGNQSGTIFALYPHQWKNSSVSTLAYTYPSVRGQMKTAEGTSFQTKMKYNGVLPALPDLGTYDKNILNQYVNEAAAEQYTGAADTYWTGKRLGKLAILAPIADQVGNTAAAAQFRSEIKSILEDWLKASNSSGALKATNVFYYNSNWGTVIGYPDSYGTANELNDHHFHYGYFIKAAAEIARTDKDWANDSNWGGMIKLLIRDIANVDRNDSMFPYLRNFDPYAGHSWASGHAKFGDGNNNESSSEAMNAWAGLILWGEATGNKTIRDAGIYQYVTEMNAINEYWFDVHNTNFPAGFTKETASMVWGGKTVGDATWWTNNPTEVHGINWLPITSASLYLTQYPEYAARNYNALLSESGGNFSPWEDLVYMYRAISDPADAKAKFSARVSQLVPEAGNSKANTYHWIHNLDALGQADPTVTADYPIYAVFNKNGVKTYIVYNMTSSAKTVRFSDGQQVTVQPNSFNVGNGGDGGGDDSDIVAPTAPTGLSVTAKTATTVSLSWAASTDNVGVTGYEVYSESSLVAAASGTAAVVSGLAPNTAYTFTVKAKDAAGNISPASNSVEVTTAPSGGDSGEIVTDDYTVDVNRVSGSEVKVVFTPMTPALYVDIHYTVSGGQQLNYRMADYNGIWEQLIGGLQAGDVIDYWFTYEKSGPQYDSPHYTFTN